MASPLSSSLKQLSPVSPHKQQGSPLSASNNNIPLSLKKDKEFFGKASNLEAGALLTDIATNTGRVVFSLQELPLRTQFKTPNNNLLQRVNEDLIKIISPTDRCGCNLKISREIDDNNKDILIWAQYQSDLTTINDENTIHKNGVHLRDIYTGLAIRVHSLAELKIGVKYFTENDNLLVRTGDNEVTLGDKVIEIFKRKANIGEEEETTNDAIREAETILAFTPGLDPSLHPQVNEVANLLLESENFPKITKCVIEGSGVHTAPLTCHVNYEGGVEGNSIIRWERCRSGESSFVPLKMKSALQYQPSIEDIDAKIRLSYLPVRADGVTGLIAYSNIIPIKVDPDIQQEVLSNVQLMGFVVKVLELNGNEFQKRALFLNEKKIKVRKRRSTTTKMNFGRDLRAYPDPSRDCCFTLELSAEDKHHFLAPSPFQRDVILLTIIEYNKLYSH